MNIWLKKHAIEHVIKPPLPGYKPRFNPVRWQPLCCFCFPGALCFRSPPTRSSTRSAFAAVVCAQLPLPSSKGIKRKAKLLQVSLQSNSLLSQLLIHGCP